MQEDLDGMCTEAEDLPLHSLALRVSQLYYYGFFETFQRTSPALWLKERKKGTSSSV
jgi:hypothetical protein